MRIRVGLFLGIILFINYAFSLPVFNIEATDYGYKADIAIGEVQLRPEHVQATTRDGQNVNETFVHVTIPSFASLNTEGLPGLPSGGFKLAIDENRALPQVELENVVEETCRLNARVYPTQTLQYTHGTSSVFTCNTKYYETARASASYVTVSEPYMIRMQKGVSLEINPVKYDIANNTITVAKSFTLKIRTAKPTMVGSYNSPDWDNLLRASFRNLDGDLGKTVASEKFRDKGKYLIFVASRLASNADVQKLVDYRAKNFTVEKVTASTAATMKAKIKTDLPAFVLLIGCWTDFTHDVGTFSTSSSSDPNGGKVFTYLNYTTVSGSDNLPDVSLGLFFTKASDAQEATHIKNFVTKTMETEDKIETLTQNVLCWAGNYQTISDGGITMPSNHCDKIHNEIITESLQPNGFTIKKILNFEAPATDGAKEALGFINSGLRFLFYNGHGVETGWAYLGANGQFADNEIWTHNGTGYLLTYFGAITNTTYPFILSCSCLTGSFWAGPNNTSPYQCPDGCWAILWTNHEKLATAYIGASQLSYFNQHGLHRGTAAAVTKKNITKFGLAKDFGIIYTKDTLPAYYTRGAEEYHYFGDPAIETRKLITPITVGNSVEHSGNALLVIGNTPQKNCIRFSLTSARGFISELTVYNLNGKVLFRKKSDNLKEIVWDTAENKPVAPGTYLVAATLNNAGPRAGSRITKLFTAAR